MDTDDTITLPYLLTCKPFGKIAIRSLPDGGRRIKAYLLVEITGRQGAQTGMAIEGSLLMRPAFGFRARVGPLFTSRSAPNLVSMVARKMGAYLARRIDADRRTSVIYWASGPAGDRIEEVGDLSAYAVERHDFNGPSQFGAAVQLLPAVRHFADRFAASPWGMYVFLTQGLIADLTAVKQYTAELAQSVAARQRNGFKLVLIGVGDKITRSHMEQLDDLNTGSGVDLWDYRMASEMKDVLEIFAETADKNTIVAPSGRILDESGATLVDFAGAGVPALLEFDLPPGCTCFTLEMAGSRVAQKVL